MNFWSVWNLRCYVFEIRIGSPKEIDHIFRYKVPGEFIPTRAIYFRTFFFITITNFIWVLKDSGSAQYILFIDGDFHIKISPNAVKFAPDIWIWMPASVIIFR